MENTEIEMKIEKLKLLRPITIPITIHHSPTEADGRYRRGALPSTVPFEIKICRFTAAIIKKYRNIDIAILNFKFTAKFLYLLYLNLRCYVRD